MRKNEIVWVNDGWTKVENASPRRHSLEVSVLAENGVVVEVRTRHNDGEETVLKKRLDENYSLPMSLEDFKVAYLADKIQLK